MALSCSKCRSYLVAYIHLELTPRARKQIDTHLNTCAACYRVYLAERDLSRDLAQSIRHIGSADDMRLNQIWSIVQSEITPHAVSRQSPSLRGLWNGEARYSFAVIALMIALLIPTLLHQGGAALALPNQPTPTSTQELAQTKDINVVVALPSATGEIDHIIAQSDAAQQPISFNSNYAPTPGATDSP
jgi:hypothetical protein